MMNREGEKKRKIYFYFSNWKREEKRLRDVRRNPYTQKATHTLFFFFFVFFEEKKQGHKIRNGVEIV
jgi:hypothetical protein